VQAIPTSLDAFETFIKQLKPGELKELVPSERAAKAAAVKALSDVVEEHAAELSEEALLLLAYAGLQSLFEDNRFVLRCAEELIRRESVQGQLGFVSVVVQARDQYDPGHRAFEDTVLDQLIDDVLPRFALTPLISLLGGLDFDVLSGADGFAELFGAAFAKVEGEIPDDLLAVVREYADDSRQHAGDLEEVMDLLTAAASRNEESGPLKEAIAQLKEDMELEASLETDDLETARALLERVGRDMPFKRATQFHNSLLPLRNFTAQLPYEFIEAVFARCWKDEREERYPETNLGRTLWPLFVRDPEAAQAFCLKFAETCDDRKLFVKVVEWAIRDAGVQSPEGEQIAKDTLALLKGLDPEKERAREALKERRSSLSSKTSWAFSQNDFDQARRLMQDESNRSIMDAGLVEDIISYAQLTDRLKAGDMTGAREIAEACLELLLYKREHPDAVPQAEPGRSLSFKERLAAKSGGVPSGISIVEFVANALVLAVGEANEATPFATSVAGLAKATLDECTDRTPIPSLAFNLGCYHAKRGEKAELLSCVEKAVGWGKTGDAFLADADFEAFWDDPEFLEALKPKDDDAGA